MTDWRDKGPEIEQERAELERFCKITAAYTLEQCQAVFLRSMSRSEMVRLFRALTDGEIRAISGEFLYLESLEGES